MAEKHTMPAPRLWQALGAMEQLTVLHSLTESEAGRAFRDMGKALLGKDLGAAAAAKARLNACLLQPARRISGDLWLDYLLQYLIFTPNRFQTLAACGIEEPHVTARMAHDLALLQSIFRCDSLTLNKECKALSALMDAPTADTIALMAGSAWGGNGIPQSALKTRGANSVVPLRFDEWMYEAPAFEACYACDETLEGLYQQLYNEDDWSTLTEPLEMLHAAYGTGEFLTHTAFFYTASGLHPRFIMADPWDALLGMEATKKTFLDDTLEFLHGEGIRHVWLHGGTGMGKSALVCSLAAQSTLRLVHVPPDSLLDPAPLLQMLSEQPLHFLLWLDDTSPDAPELRRLCQCMQAYPRQNIMMVATSRHAPQSSFFGRVLSFTPPTRQVFIEIVLDMARRRGESLDYELVQEAASKWQYEREDLSLHAASRLCEQLLSENL